MSALLLFLFFIMRLTLADTSSAFASPVELNEITAAIQKKGTHWTAGETSVSKLPPEKRQMRLGALEPNLSGSERMEGAMVPPAALLSTLDWRTYNGHNYVGPIRNQGDCGSCWAFATTACLESYRAIWTGWTPSLSGWVALPLDNDIFVIPARSFINLSEQVLVSCSGAGSCSGGYVSSASNFIRDTGLPLEACYPYKATNGDCSQACIDWRSNVSKIDSWISLSQNADIIKSALNTYGPLVVQFHVYTDFYYYSSGVYSATWGSYEGDHAILVVGYDDNKQCFIVKNSWGTDWGESGFFRIAYSQVTSPYASFGLVTIAYVFNP
jgi:C1A family cysteine protease